MLTSLFEAGVRMIWPTPGTARPYGHSLTLGFLKHSLFEAPAYVCTLVGGNIRGTIYVNLLNTFQKSQRLR